MYNVVKERRFDMPRKITGDARKVTVGMSCQGCGQPGMARVDKGLPAGTWCKRCWDSMIAICRKKSW